MTAKSKSTEKQMNGKTRQTKKRRKYFRNRPAPRIKMPEKHYQCRQIIDHKLCELCKKRDQDEKFILCDECDDAYHMPCLDPPLLIVPEGQWRCPRCQISQKQPKTINNNGIQGPSQVCTKCSARLEKLKIIKYQNEDGKLLEQVLSQNTKLQCSYCQKWFHEQCASPRINSLNCYQCEMFLRNSSPKNHLQFLAYIKKQTQLVYKSNYLQLYDKNYDQKLLPFCIINLKNNNEDNQKKRNTYFCLQLKIFKQPTHWEPITRYEGSLYYALKTKRLVFCDEQLYKSQQLLSKNDSSKDILGVRPLHQADVQIYELFKNKIKTGAVGPFQIKQNRQKGFYVETTSYIQKGTIICQYSGQVSCHRQSLKQVNNDSIFTLLIAGSAQQDLNIIPNKFGNISRFICGVNNSEKQQIRLINIEAIKFSYKGRMRIIFISKKNIEKGETLYLDYNGGTYQQYPTANFIK